VGAYAIESRVKVVEEVVRELGRGKGASSYLAT